MTTENTSVETPISNMVMNTPRTIYLNNPKHFQDEEEELAPAAETVATPEPKTEPEDSWEKRHNDMKSFKDRQINEREAKIKELETALQTAKQAATTEVKYPKTAEERRLFREAHSDLYDIIKSEILEEKDDLMTKVKQEIGELRKQSEAVEQEKGWTKLRELHPDVDSIKDDPKFSEWFALQTSGIQSLINSKNVTEISKGLDLYKADLGIKTSKQLKEEKLASTKAVDTSSKPDPASAGAKVWTLSEIHRMSVSQYSKHKTEIDKAMNEGRIIEDM